MSREGAYEQIKFINEAIKDRQSKNEPTYFSVTLEKFGEETPMVNKEEGSSFYETIIQYLAKYDISSIIIDLFHGKSPNIKTPFKTIRIPLKKSGEISLGNARAKEEDIKVLPSESFISPEKHFLSIVEKERQVMLLEFDLKKLQYENEELRRKNKRKKKYIEELETELGKVERDKKHSLGNVSLGAVGANALEQFAKSDFGLGLLKNVFGAKQEVLNGLLGGDAVQEKTSEEVKSTATVVSVSKEEPEKVFSEEEKKRAAVIKYINDFLAKSPDAVLRLYYELVQLLGTDEQTLQSIHAQVKAYREKQKAFIEEKLKQKTEKKEEAVNGGDEEEKDFEDSS